MKTKEQQYSELDDYLPTQLGAMVNQVWHDDPKRLAIVLSRYKFVSKMLAGKENVLEIGCADGFASRIVGKEVKRLTLSDFDPEFIKLVKRQISDPWGQNAFVHDVSEVPTESRYDAIYCLDVFEHIEPAKEHDVLRNLSDSLVQKGVAIIGIPSLESQRFASPQSKAGHVNCKSGSDFKALLEKHFGNVFLFSMNDEVVHTGFFPMAHYLMALCIK